MKIILWPNDILKKVCGHVQEAEGPAIVGTMTVDKLGPIFEEMEALMLAGNGIGLAAPQVGLTCRIVLATPQYQAPRRFVNPVIQSFLGEWVPMTEGCLSIPGIVETVRRNTAIEVSYFDLAKKERVLEKATGQLAHVLQHEIEHLDGKMMTDHLKPAQRDQVRAWMKRVRASKTKE